MVFALGASFRGMAGLMEPDAYKGRVIEEEHSKSKIDDGDEKPNG